MKTSVPKLHSIKWKNGAMADNVTCLNTYNCAGVPVDNVLKGAYEVGCYEIVVFGYDRDGREYIAGSPASCKDAAYMFARGQLAMLREGDE